MPLISGQPQGGGAGQPLAIPPAPVAPLQTPNLGIQTLSGGRPSPAPPVQEDPNTQRLFQLGQTMMERGWRSKQDQKQRDFQAGETEKSREFGRSQAENARAHDIEMEGIREQSEQKRMEKQAKLTMQASRFAELTRARSELGPRLKSEYQGKVALLNDHFYSAIGAGTASITDYHQARASLADEYGDSIYQGEQDIIGRIMPTEEEAKAWGAAGRATPPSIPTPGQVPGDPSMGPSSKKYLEHPQFGNLDAPTWAAYEASDAMNQMLLHKLAQAKTDGERTRLKEDFVKTGLDWEINQQSTNEQIDTFVEMVTGIPGGTEGDAMLSGAAPTFSPTVNRTVEEVVNRIKEGGDPKQILDEVMPRMYRFFEKTQGAAGTWNVVKSMTGPAQFDEEGNEKGEVMDPGSKIVFGRISEMVAVAMQHRVSDSKSQFQKTNKWYSLDYSPEMQTKYTKVIEDLSEIGRVGKAAAKEQNIFRSELQRMIKDVESSKTSVRGMSFKDFREGPMADMQSRFNEARLFSGPFGGSIASELAGQVNDLYTAMNLKPYTLKEQADKMQVEAFKQQQQGPPAAQAPQPMAAPASVGQSQLAPQRPATPSAGPVDPAQMEAYKKSVQPAPKEKTNASDGS